MLMEKKDFIPIRLIYLMANPTRQLHTTEFHMVVKIAHSFDIFFLQMVIYSQNRNDPFHF